MLPSATLSWRSANNCINYYLLSPLELLLFGDPFALAAVKVASLRSSLLFFALLSIPEVPKSIIIILSLLAFVSSRFGNARDCADLLAIPTEAYEKKTVSLGTKTANVLTLQ